MHTLIFFLVFTFMLLPAVLLVTPRAIVQRVFGSMLLLAIALCWTASANATAPMTTSTGTFQANLSLQCSQTLASTNSNLTTLQINPTVQGLAKFTSTGAGANAINQGNTKLYSISASSSTTIDLSAAITNFVNSSTATFTRVKIIIIRLLSTTDDSVNGTAAASITFGNAASNQFVSQSGSGFLLSTTGTYDVPNGGGHAFWCSNANGVVIDGTHKSLKILNNDAGVAATVELTLVGADV